MIFGNYGEAVAASSILQHTLTIDLRRPATDPDAFHLCTPHAGSNALDNQAAFKLSHHGDDDDQGAAQGTARVELFTEADEFDSEVIEFVECFQEVFGGTGQAIAGPNRDQIEVAAAGICE